jgi:phage-related baseplate assembly protein
VTLAFAVGNDLDAIGSRYPGGVARLPIVANPRPYTEAPVDWESDDRYRARIWLSPNAFTTAGSADAYVFWALTAVPTLRDASAVVNRPIPTADPTVIVTCLADNPVNFIPSDADLLAVHRKLHQTDIKPLTDVVAVSVPIIIDTDIEVDLWFYPGVDKVVATGLAKDRLAVLVNATRYLGMDLTLSAINEAARADGVENVIIHKPPTDLIATSRQVVRVGKTFVNPRGFTE